MSVRPVKSFNAPLRMSAVLVWIEATADWEPLVENARPVGRKRERGAFLGRFFFSLLQEFSF